MRPERIANTIATMFAQRTTLYIVGPPGVGKTTLPKQVAKRAGIGCITRHVPSMLPEHFGLIMPSADRTTLDFIVDANLPTVEAVKSERLPEQGIYILDELPQGDPTLQKLVANLIQERSIYGHKIAPGWMFVATGNRQSDKAGANRILSHLQDRMTEVELTVSVEDWVAWADAAGIHGDIVEFLQFKPDLLSAFDPAKQVCPSPRGWSEKVNALLKAGIPDDDLHELAAGAVGSGASAEFLAYRDMKGKLPTIEQLLKEPTKTPLEDRPDVEFAVLNMCAARLIDGDDMRRQAELPKLWQVVDRLSPDLTAQFWKAVARRWSGVMRHDLYRQWAEKFAKLG